MKKIRILFVCKFNRFRSMVAEAYLNKIKRNRNVLVNSAGIIQGFLPLDKNQVKIAKEYGILIKGKPKAMSMEMLRKQDKIIIVANDIPKQIFIVPKGARKDYPYGEKVMIWNVPDVKRGNDISGNKKSIEFIIRKVNELNKQLREGK